MAGSINSHDHDVRALRGVQKVLRTKGAGTEDSRDARAASEQLKKEEESKQGDRAQNTRFAPMLEKLLVAAEVSVDAKRSEKIEGNAPKQMVEADQASDETEEREAEHEKVEARERTPEERTQVEAESSEFDVVSEDVETTVEADTEAEVQVDAEQAKLEVAQQEAQAISQVEAPVEVEQSSEETAQAAEEALTVDLPEQVTQATQAAQQVQAPVRDAAPVESNAPQQAPTREEYVPTTAKGDGEAQQNFNQQSEARPQPVNPQAVQQASNQQAQQQPSETAIRVDANQPTNEQSPQTQPTPAEPTLKPEEYVATTADGDDDLRFTHTDAAQQPASPEFTSPDGGTSSAAAFSQSQLAAASAAGSLAASAAAGATTGSVSSVAAGAVQAANAANAAGAQAAAGANGASGGENASQSGLGSGQDQKSEDKQAAKARQADQPRFSRVMQERQIETVRQIAKAISLRSAMANNGQVTMLLNPEALGSVRLDMTFDQDGAISVEATVEHAGTRHVLAGGADELRVQLQQDNIQLQRFDVQQGEHGVLRDPSTASQDQSGQGQRNASASSSGNAGGAAEAGSNDAANNDSSSVALGQVNVRAYAHAP